jgi:hypothetical protein
MQGGHACIYTFVFFLVVVVNIWLQLHDLIKCVCTFITYNVMLYIVTYQGFRSRWKFISTPKTQHSTVKCDQPFSKHTSDVYTQRCPTQESYRTSSGNLPTRTHILAVRESPNTGARPASTLSRHKLTFLQSGSFQTHQDNPSSTVTTRMLLSLAPNTN